MRETRQTVLPVPVGISNRQCPWMTVNAPGERGAISGKYSIRITQGIFTNIIWYLLYILYEIKMGDHLHHHE